MNGKHKFVADFLYNDSGVGQENQWTYEWALSLRSEYVTDRWVVMTEDLSETMATRLMVSLRRSAKGNSGPQ